MQREYPIPNDISHIKEEVVVKGEEFIDLSKVEIQEGKTRK